MANESTGQAWLGGGPVDFETIYRRSFRSVSKRLARLGVPAAQLEDVTHDVFLLIHRRLGDLRDPTGLPAWTSQFARRAASDFRRNLRRQGAREEVSHDIPAEDRSDEGAEKRQGLLLLQSLLDKMSVDLREIFVLIEVEEMSGREAAVLLGLNLSTAYSRLRLARAAFRSLTDQLRPGRPS